VVCGMWSHDGSLPACGHVYAPATLAVQHQAICPQSVPNARKCARYLDMQHLVRRAETLIVGRGYFSHESRNTKFEHGFVQVSRVSPLRPLGMPPWTT
jgi:hypothetical protein